MIASRKKPPNRSKALGGTVDSNSPADFARFAKAVSIAVNGLISALATVVRFLTAVRLGATRTGALFAAGTLAFATPFFGWSTAFFAQSVSDSLLMFAAAAIAFAFAGRELQSVSSTHAVLWG